MKWLRRRLQKWLGVEAIDERVSDLELEVRRGVPTISWNGVIHPLDSPEGRSIEKRLSGSEDDQVRKGYGKP